MMTATIINRARGKAKRATFKMVIKTIIAQVARSTIHSFNHQADSRFNHFNQFDGANEWLGAVHIALNDRLMIAFSPLCVEM